MKVSKLHLPRCLFLCNLLAVNSFFFSLRLLAVRNEKAPLPFISGSILFPCVGSNELLHLGC